jgi:hypothetical protein
MKGMVKLPPERRGTARRGLSIKEIAAIGKAGLNQSMTLLEIPKASTKVSERFAVLQINHIKNPK